MIDQAQVQARLAAAIEGLFVNDGILLEYDVGERTIAARIAGYLQGVFPSHDVDVEYNRHGLDPKVVQLPMECRGGGPRLVIPDIIVHRRANDDDNLLVVELKKESSPEPRDCDRAKIDAIMRELLYAHGVLIELPAGEGATRRPVRYEWR